MVVIAVFAVKPMSNFFIYYLFDKNFHSAGWNK